MFETKIQHQRDNMAKDLQKYSVIVCLRSVNKNVSKLVLTELNKDTKIESQTEQFTANFMYRLIND